MKYECDTFASTCKVICSIRNLLNERVKKGRGGEHKGTEVQDERTRTGKYTAEQRVTALLIVRSCEVLRGLNS